MPLNTVSADVGRSQVRNLNLDAGTLRGSTGLRLDHATEPVFADDVVRADAGDFIGRCNEIWWQLIAGRMRSFFVVVPTPDSADVVQVFFGDDNELVETLELQSLDESFDMGPQNRGHRNRPFDLNTAGFEHFASSRISSGVQGRPGFLFDAASFSACDLFFPNPPNEGVINDGRNQIPKLNSQLLTDLQ